MTQSRTLVFVGGDPPHPGLVRLLPRVTHVVAADSGWEHAVTLGLVPHSLVGDLDSISEAHLSQARASGARVVEYPVDKDQTDTELAVEHAIELGSDHITVVSGGGNRFDHLLAMIHSLAGVDIPLAAFVGTARIEFARPGRGVDIALRPGSTVSLIPIGADAHDVVTRGLKWNLDHDVLTSLSSRGVSNEATGHAMSVSVGSGTIAVVCPHYTEAGEG